MRPFISWIRNLGKWSAPRFLFVTFSLTVSLIFSVIFSLPAYSEVASKQDFQVLSLTGSLDVRAPGALLFTPWSIGGPPLPEGTWIRLRGGPLAALGLRHEASRRNFEVKGERAFVLAAAEIFPAVQTLRAATPNLPDNVEAAKATKELGSIDRLIAYFVPTEMTNGARDGETMRERWLANPIRPTFPGPVHLIQTEVVPVSVTLSWPVGGGQKEPHKVFLWSENHMAFSPHMTARGGKATVQLSKMGRFYWQIEDASGAFVSPPRTIIVSEPIRRPVSDAQREATNALNIKSVDLFSPLKNSIFYGCFDKGPVQIPILFPHLGALARSYTVERTPRGATQGLPRRTAVLPDAPQVQIYVSVESPGSYNLRVIGYRNLLPEPKELAVALSDMTPIQVESLCGIESNPLLMLKALSQKRFKGLPDVGATVFLSTR